MKNKKCTGKAKRQLLHPGRSGNSGGAFPGRVHGAFGVGTDGRPFPEIFEAGCIFRCAPGNHRGFAGRRPCDRLALGQLQQLFALLALDGHDRRHESAWHFPPGRLRQGPLSKEISLNFPGVSGEIFFDCFTFSHSVVYWRQPLYLRKGENCHDISGNAL